MKTFRSLVLVRAPLEATWCAVRDHLPELAASMDDIERVTVVERKALAGGQLRLVNEWQSRQRIPAMLRKTLGGEIIGWTDRNVWDERNRTCRWSIEPWVLPEHIRCEGATRYEAAMGKQGTRVTFEGEFELADAALAGLGGALLASLTPFVESLVTTLIPKNLRKVIEAAAERSRAGA